MVLIAKYKIWNLLLQFTDQLTWIIENNLDINSLYNYSILMHDDVKQKLWFQYFN